MLRICHSNSELLYDWPFTSNQFVYAPRISRLTTRDFGGELNPCGHSSYVTSSLTRGWVCLLWIGFTSPLHSSRAVNIEVLYLSIVNMSVIAVRFATRWCAHVHDCNHPFWNVTRFLLASSHLKFSSSPKVLPLWNLALSGLPIHLHGFQYCFHGYIIHLFATGTNITATGLRIILELVVGKKKEGTVWLNWSAPEQGPVAGSGEHGNEPSGSI
jgi:hypothetical protein